MKMKSIFLSVSFALILCAGVSQAQSLKFGPVAGVNFSKYSGEDVDNANLKTGFQLGLAGEFKLSAFGVESGIYYTSKGSQTTEEGELPLIGTPYSSKVSNTTSYIEIPVLAKIHGPLGLNIFAGPQASFLLANKTYTEYTLGNTTTEDENSSTDGFNTFDASLVVGLGLDLPMGLTARASYDWGFMPVYNTSEDNDDLKVHNATIKISLGLMF